MRCRGVQGKNPYICQTGLRRNSHGRQALACGRCRESLHAPIQVLRQNSARFSEESHVGYVTNGVHLPTWTAKEWKEVYGKYFDKNFLNDQSNASIWEKIYDVPDDVVWQTRMKLKVKLIDYIRERFRDNWLKNQGDPSRVVSLLDKINPNALLIGFARRFATYKRAHLLFSDLDRLAKIVNNPDYPVQFIFAGKAHPADGAGQGLIKRIFEISQRPEFIGKILFVENYDMQLARRLVSGVDIWMNTPTRPLEASGTSGEKALMNGVVNLSVLDGWWYEGYREGAGWALTDKRTYQNQEHQDKLDAWTIYSMLEQEIIPLYYMLSLPSFPDVMATRSIPIALSRPCSSTTWVTVNSLSLMRLPLVRFSLRVVETTRMLSQRSATRCFHAAISFAFLLLSALSTLKRAASLQHLVRKH